MAEHKFEISTEWKGNKGSGTFDPRSYERDFIAFGEKKNSQIQGSSDSYFYGDIGKYSPQDLILSSISSCHMLWYLNFCAREGVIVLDYYDHASGKLVDRLEGEAYGKIKEVNLYPVVTISKPEMEEKAILLHHKTHEHCFIAKSCNFPVNFYPKIIVQDV